MFYKSPAHAYVSVCEQVLQGRGRATKEAAPYAIALAAALSAETPFVHIDSITVCPICPCPWPTDMHVIGAVY